MTDNVAITAGSGTTVATDDVGGVHYQLVKLAHGALDTANVVSTASPLPAVEPKPGTSTLANVTASATTVTLQASNTGRKGWFVFNDSTAILYVKLGATASTTSYTVQVGPNGYYELPRPHYTGVIDGIWSAANGAARVTELT